MKLATSSPERQREDVLTAAASVGGHIVGWADDWEVSGATDPMTRLKLGAWLRDERGPYDGLVAAAVDRLGRNVVDCLNTGYKMRDGGKLLVTYGHDDPWDLNDQVDENRLKLAGLPPACPLPVPSKIIPAPVNYLDHKAEMEVEHTVADLGIFLKARTSVIGPGDTAVLPYTDKRFDQEAELGVVIGSRVRDIAPQNALDAVFGYTCLFDMSMRSTEDRSTCKSFDTFTPIGPCVVTKHMTCWVNGTLRQDTSIGDLIFDVPTPVVYASSVMTLEPGDVIATGAPAGVGPVADGDALAMEITGLSRLEISVFAGDAAPYEERTGAHLNPVRLRNRTRTSA